MTEEKNAVYQKKLQGLRQSFLKQMPARLAEMRGKVETLAVDCIPDHGFLTDLHRFFHTLKGTGKSFEFKGFGELAQGAESLLAPVLEDPGLWKSGIRTRVLTCLDDLAACLADFDKPIEEPSLVPEGLPESPGGTEALSPEPRNRSALVHVCDDDQFQAGLVSSQLQYFGYRVETFGDTQSLARAVRDQRPEVIIMDIMFPEGPFRGTEVLADLQQEGIRIPAIFISGRSDFEARIRGIRAGGVAFFPKPVEALDLLGILDRLTSQATLVPYKILVIDDELPVAEYHALILENAGMVVKIVQQPETLLEVVKGFKPDLVLMDMYMPYCTGHEAAALIRQIPEFLSLPIIFLSAETDKQKQFSAMSVGVEGFLTKPIQAADLVSSVLLSANRMRDLRSLMTRDSLTGLFNHTTTTQILESSLGTAVRTGSCLCFAMIDLDRFKSVNDTYGHPMGDQVLLAMSRVLRQRLRVSDVVGRYGGEEFAVLLSDLDRQSASKLMNSLREDFSRIVFHGAGQAFSCTFSCGIADSFHHTDVDALRDAADRALYAAKHGGRNQVVLDEEEISHGN